MTPSAGPTRPWLEPLLWLALGAGSIPVVRGWQPSAEMTVLVVAVVVVASAGLLHTVRQTTLLSLRGGVAALLATAAAGCAAALVIRMLYLMLAPDVRPFGLAFNIVSDSGWTATNAVVVGLLLRVLRR